jgi:two-component system sensor histidine kinase YesM
MLSRFKYKRIQNQLFISYSLLIMSIIIILILWISIYFNLLIEYQASETVKQLANNINTKINATIENMDMAAKQVVFSDTIIQYILDFPSNGSMLLDFSSRLIISNTLHEIIGPRYPSVEQINLINCTDGNYIGAGIYPLETLVALSEIRESYYVTSTLEKNGQMNIIPPHKDQWSGNSGAIVFSVARSFKSARNPALQGIVEVPCSQQVLSDIVKNSLSLNKYVVKIFIFSQDGTTIYCSKDAENEAASYYKIITENFNKADSTLNIDHELLSYSVSDYTGWTVLLVADQKQVVNPVTVFRSNILLFMLTSIPATLLLSYFISKRFTKPIKKIYSSINNLNLRAVKDEQILPSNPQYNELEELYLSFQRLCKSLERAIAEAATARSYEMEAHMLALESRINPHFLFNTIATIQAIAEEENCRSISEICGEMSTLLRYSISKDKIESTIESEMSIASIYMDLMYRRYRDRLSYNFKLDPKIAKIKVPRMILQPILENCFKHGFNSSSDWRIDVSAYAHEDSWYIKVTDNGVGIEEKVVKTLYEAFESASTTNPIKSTKLKGVGLANIAIRLKLEFGNKACFSIFTNEDGGTTIIIGVKGGLANGH